MGRAPLSDPDTVKVGCSAVSAVTLPLPSGERLPHQKAAIRITATSAAIGSQPKRRTAEGSSSSTTILVSAAEYRLLRALVGLCRCLRRWLLIVLQVEIFCIVGRRSPAIDSDCSRCGCIRQIILTRSGGRIWASGSGDQHLVRSVELMLQRLVLLNRCCTDWYARGRGRCWRWNRRRNSVMGDRWSRAECEPPIAARPLRARSLDGSSATTRSRAARFSSRSSATPASQSQPWALTWVFTCYQTEQFARFGLVAGSCRFNA